MEVFVPKVYKLCTRQGKRVREEVPFIQDLLFVHETRLNLDPIVKKTPTLQYRWLRNTWREYPIRNFTSAGLRFQFSVENAYTLRYFTPASTAPAMVSIRAYSPAS